MTRLAIEVALPRIVPLGIHLLLAELIVQLNTNPDAVGLALHFATVPDCSELAFVGKRDQADSLPDLETGVVL